MPEPLNQVIEPTADPLAGIRAGVAAHSAVIEASRRAGAELQPAAPPPAATERSV